MVMAASHCDAPSAEQDSITLVLGNLLCNWQRGQPWDLPQVLAPIGGSSRQCAYRLVKTIQTFEWATSV